MSRRSPLLGFGLAWACLLALLALLLPVAARAEGKPNIGLSATAPTSVLFGAKATVTLEASNPAGEPYGYNLSYRAVLPEGVAYVSGSSKLGSGGPAPTPTVIENQPKAKETTLIWSNVGDLSPASHSTLSFEVTPSQVTYPVASEFTVPAEAFVAEAPRYLPKFSAAGKPEGPGPTSFTGFAKGSAKTAISALEIKQEEGSPEGEILRGVHDHQTVYKVTVTNNKVNATTNVNVDDWLPASLEYLGCGGAGSDHTTEAPTNPGSKEEYPGSGPIEVAVLGGCTAPALVETVETDPDGAGVDPTAVYTHLRWAVAELKPGESRTFEFRAAVPLRENTTEWTGFEPTPASGHQAANLDNNSGAETRDGESIVTFAKGEGLYKSTTPVSAEEHMTRVAKDLTTEKSADLTTLSDGQVSKWTILVHSSEYRYNTKVEVTDTLPNGLCPLSSTNLTGSAECEPNKAPSSPYTTAKEEENGTWKLVWNETTDPALATLKQNETTTITFYSNTRTHYQSKHAQAGPILSNDKIENTVIANATTNVVCANDTDCSEEGAKPIDHERPLSEPVQDNSHFTQSAVGPAIKKEIAASGTNCLGDTYTGATPVYHPGDLICWRLQASFPATLSTHGTEVTDFLPELVLFDEAFNTGKGEAPTAEDTLPATTFDHSEAPGTEPGGALKWTLPESGIVGNGSQRFERVFATKATLAQGTPLGDLQGNLMKFASINSAGESFALRAEANFKLQFPQLSLVKQIVKINGAAFGPATSATVKGGSEVEFALTVKNAGEVEALNTEVRDLLPNGIACAEIVAGSISNKGACASGVITWGETGLGQEAIGVPALGQTVLHFSVKLSTTLDPATTLEDKAGVREYHSATNTGGEYTYIPAENIDPLLTEKEANVPAANAHASVKTEEVTLTKAHTTSVNETSNKANEATIGEEVTFEVTTTIPSGTTLSGFAKITDPSIPTTRLTYEAGSVEALVNGSTAPGTFKHEDIAGSPVVTLPENYAAPATESVKVTMRFRTRVANVVLNNAAGSAAEKAIPNKGKLAWTNPLSGAQTREAGNEVPLVEPSIALTEKNNTAEGKVHGGQLVEYKLELQNAASASTAFDSKVIDTVPIGLTLSNAAGEPYKEGEVIESGGVWNEKARTITWTLTPIEPNHEMPLVFFAKVNEEPVSSTILTNKAIATTTSIAGASASERTAANAPTTEIKAHYESESKGNLEVEGATIAKGGSPEQATIGEKVTYTLTVTVPARTAAFNDTVIDTLPSTLELAGYTSAKCTSGCAAGPTEIEPKPYTAENNVAAHTNRVAWYLGNITGAPEVRVLKLVYVALVRAKERGGTEAEVKAPAVLENSASLYYNTTDSGYTFNAATVPPASFNKTVGPVHAKTTVIEPSVAIVKEASVNGGAFGTTTPFAVTDGSTIVYRLKVTNSGAAPAYNVSVTDALPASGLTEVKTVANAPIVSHEAEVTKETASELAWTIPALGTTATPGKTITLEYTAKLAPVTTLHQGQEIANTAKVPTYFGVPAAERTGESYFHEEIKYREYKGNEKTLKAKVALPTITIEKAALEGAKYQASANAEVGQAFTWRVIVKNTSSVAAKNLKVSDILPPNWEYAGGASFTKGGSLIPIESGTLEPGKELTWSTSIELAAGASTTLTYQAKPTLAAESNPGSGAGHPNKNTASATVLDAAGNPEDAEGPFAAGPATAQGILIVPVLEVTKIAAKASIAAGENDSYKIRIHNSGAGVAREVLAEDTLPIGMTYKAGSATALPTTGFSEKSASATKVVWEVVSIAAGASVEIEVPVGTEASLASGTKLTNKVAVQAPAAPTPVKAEGTITLTTSADLEASKEALGKGPYVPGEPLTYKIEATNKGPSVAHAVKLTDELPSGETFVKASSAKCKVVGQLVTCEEAELAPGAKVSFEIEVALASSAKGAIVNPVVVKSETPDPEEKNNKATATITPEPQADLELKKTVLVTPVVLGETASFELLVTNNGPSDAEGVQIVDHLPSGLVYKSASGAEATCKAGGTEGREVTCTLPKAISAKKGTAAIVLVLETKALGTLLNKATVSSPAKDIEPANNSSEANVLVVPAPALTKASSSPEATIGQRIKYTLTLTLPAHLTTYDHTVIDTLPNTLDFDEYSSAQCTAGCTAETTPTISTYKPSVEGSGTTRIAWDLGDVPASEAARTITLSYFASVRSTHRVAGGEVKAGEALENSASDYYDQSNKQSFNENTIPAAGSFDRAGMPQNTSTPVVEPALTLTKEASVDGGEFKAAPFTIAAGDTVAYRLKVKNTGTSPAYETAVRDTPPSGLVVTETVPNLAATVTKAWSEGTPEIDWQIAGPLAVGETVTLEYKAKLTVGSVKDGQKLTNTASVPSYFGVAEAERGEGKENFAGEKILYREYKGPSAQLTATVALPVLEVSKEAVKASVAAGEEDTYTIVVKNTGAGVAHEVLAEDTLPVGMTYAADSATALPATGFSEKSSSATKVVWELSSIAAGASVEIRVPVGTEANLAEGTKLTNTVAVHAPAAPTPVQAEGTITLSTKADLRAAKIASVNPVAPGGEETYTISVTNEGPSVAREVKLTDPLPADTKLVSAPGCTDEKVAGTVECLVGDMLVGETVGYHVTVSVESSVTTPILNTVEATSPTLDPEPNNNKASVEVGVTPEADLALEKKALASKVTDGQQVAFELTAMNKGPSDALEAEVVDTLPAGLKYVSANGATCTAEGQEVSCKLGTLASDTHVSFELVTKAEAPGDLINSATVSSPTPDPEPNNNEATAEVKVLPSADLQITKTAAPSTVKVGENVTYTLAVLNKGPDAAQSVVVSDDLPAGESYVSDNAGCKVNVQEVKCELGELAKGAKSTIQIVVKIGLTLSHSTVANTAIVSSPTADPEPLNNKSTAEVEVEPAADLQISKTALTPEVLHGQQAVFSLAVTNKGPDAAVAAKIVDTLPAGLAYVSATGATCTAVGQEVTCTLGTLTSGASVTVELTTQPSGLGPYTNTAVVSSTTPDPEPSNNSSEASVMVLPAADLALEKTATPTTVEVPGEVTYTLTVTNNGPDAAQDVVVTDPLPAGETYVSDDAGCAVAGQTVTCGLGELADGATRTIHLHVSVGVALSSQTVTNTAEVTSATGDPVKSNNTAHASVQTGPAPTPTPTPTPAQPGTSTTLTSDPGSGVSPTTGTGDPTRVTLRKLVREHEVAPGGRLDYRLIVRNAGAQTAEGLKVCDDLPEQTTVLGRGGGHLAGARICFRLATLAAGRSHTFTLVLRADSDARTRIVNHATVTGRNFDPAHAQASTPVTSVGIAPARENHVTG